MHYFLTCQFDYFCQKHHCEPGSFCHMYGHFVSNYAQTDFLGLIFHFRSFLFVEIINLLVLPVVWLSTLPHLDLRLSDLGLINTNKFLTPFLNN